MKPLSDMLTRLNSAFRVVGTEEELQARARAAHEDLQVRLLPDRMADWGVGRREREAVLAAKLQPTPSLGWARHFAQHPELLTLVLWGGTGAGKSVAAAWWLAQCARMRIVTADTGPTWRWDARARFCTPFELEAKARSYDSHDRHWMADVLACSALVVDDLGTEQGDLRSTVARVLFERTREQRRTLITTNLSPADFLERYDARNVSRIEQAGGFRACGEVDLRRKQPAAAGGGS